MDPEQPRPDRRADDERIARLEAIAEARAVELERIQRELELGRGELRELLRDHGTNIDELVKVQAARIDETRRSVGGLRDDLRAIREKTDACAQAPKVEEELASVRTSVAAIADRIDASENERNRNRTTIAVAVIGGCATVLVAVVGAVVAIVSGA